MKTVSTIFAAAVALGLQGSFVAAHAVNASGHCTGMTVTDYISSDAYNITNSTSFVSITDGHLNFTTSSPGCVVITFSAPVFVTPPGSGHDGLHVRTLLDGSSLCVPAAANDLFLSGANPIPTSANSTTHICKNLTAGVHTVQVQYRSGFGDDVGSFGHVLTATHN